MPLDQLATRGGTVTTPDLIPAARPIPVVALLRKLATDRIALLGLVSIALGASLWVAAFLTWNT